ncbi:MAG TPA: hypothetical protein VEF03_07285 [Candidatus Binataceae bacterium]|nr:hypothetical protein [Candidatus Binataceae bacterium]
MKTSRLYPVAVVLSVLLPILAISFSSALAQLTAMGPPLPTTLIISKPAPGQGFGDKPLITVGVKDKTYKFVLNDAYVDDPAQIIHWPDIWQYVRQYRPNFQAQGIDFDQFEKIKPGEIVTIKGMFAAMGRTFEVVSVTPGGGIFAPKGHE